MRDSIQLLVQQGNVLYSDASDVPAWVVSAANYYATSHGEALFSVYQGRWNLMIRDIEREILPVTLWNGSGTMGVPGERRFETKKIIVHRKKNGESLRSFKYPPKQTEDETKPVKPWKRRQKENCVQSPTAIAIAYFRSNSKCVYPLIGGRKVEHFQRNTGALKIKLNFRTNTITRKCS